MIYQINDNYYVKVGSKYVLLNMDVNKHGELIMTPTNKKIEDTKGYKIKPIVLKDNKESIIKKLKKYSTNDDKFLK